MSDLDARLAQYREEWLWREADAENRAGYGAHMGQMLYRLPRDGQTDDMKASIESMISDLDALAAKVARVEAVVERADSEWVALKPDGWASNEADQQTIGFAKAALDWLRENITAALDASETP